MLAQGEPRRASHEPAHNLWSKRREAPRGFRTASTSSALQSRVRGSPGALAFGRPAMPRIVDSVMTRSALRPQGSHCPQAAACYLLFFHFCQQYTVVD